MSLGEFDIIARYFARKTERGDVLLGIGDDAAVVDSQPGRKLVIAMDTIVEGVHLAPEIILDRYKDHPNVCPLVVYLSDEEDHRARFHVRALGTSMRRRRR